VDILYLLIPLSIVLVLGILGIFGWALYNSQFEDLDREGDRILEPEAHALDIDQSPSGAARQKSLVTNR